MTLPFVEWLIGTIRREYLDPVLVWASVEPKSWDAADTPHMTKDAFAPFVCAALKQDGGR